MQLGGLVSGMDTQGMIDQLMQTARQPLIKLQQSLQKLDTKKSTFKEVDDQLFTLKKSLLDLRLESTFKSKKVLSSDDKLVTATATVEAAPGLHTVSITQTAQAAFVRSQYTRATLNSSSGNSTGIASLTGRPDESSLKGSHEISITGEGSLYRARSVFKPTGGGNLTTLSSAAAESGTVEGTMGSAIDASNNQLTATVNGQTVTVTLDNANADATSMSRVGADVEDKLNAALNTALNTTDVTYVAVRATRDATTAKDSFVLYSTNGGAISVDNSGAASALGFASGGTSGSVSSIVTDVTASDLNSLLMEMNEPSTGLIRGVRFAADSGGLQVGSTTVYVSNSLNAIGPSKSKITGAEDVSGSGSLNTSVKNLASAGFATAADEKTNGTFTINNVQIAIGDYTKLSVNDVLGLINGSGAGVTATYDSASDRFVLTSNENSSTAITLGDAKDTSNFLTLAKLTSLQGAAFTTGSASSAISSTSPLSSAGFSLPPTSGTFTVNGIAIYFDASTDSLQNLISKINNSGAKVTASYDSKSDLFTLASTTGKVDSNAEKITLGSANDTSNILSALNLVTDRYATATTSLAPAGDRGADTITVTPTGASSARSATIGATVGSGAYQENAGLVNWSNGIAAGAVFNVQAGNAGTDAFSWTNNSGKTISNIDDFVTAWNSTGNWSSGRVEVGVVEESDDSLRFFSRADDASGGAAGFTIDGASVGDLYELGLATDPASVTETVNYGTAATASAEYNALNVAFSVNTTSGLGVKASTDGSGGITFTSSTAGYSGGFTLQDEASQPVNTIADFFGSSSVSVALSATQEAGYSGRDAVFSVDGVGYTRSTNAVDDVLAGTTLNLNAPTTTPVTITIQNDTDKALDKITTFIVQYNITISMLNPPQLTDEQKAYLDPLTDDQKSSMTSTQISNYEAYYELYNGYQDIQRESSLRTLTSSFRQITTSPVRNATPAMNLLAQLGISAGSIGGFEDARDGYLLEKISDGASLDDYTKTIREDLAENSTLANALANDVDDVYRLFSLQGGNDEDYGIARSLNDLVDSYSGTDGIVQQQIKNNGSIDQQISDYNDKIDTMQTRLDNQENRLWDQFNTMEQELAKLNQNSSAVSSLLGQSSSKS